MQAFLSIACPLILGSVRQSTDNFLTEYDLNFQHMLSSAAEHKRIERTERSGASARPEVGVTIAVPDFE